MAVPVHKRSMSKLEFFNNLNKLYDTIMYCLIKDFGIKGVCKDLKVFTNNAKMTKEDAVAFRNICETYRVGVEVSYPLWVLENFRTEVLNSLNRLLHEVTIANSIYPNTEYEFNLRREHQHLAISECEYLLQLFQRIISILPVNLEKYQKIVEMICKEIDLLRIWKKSSNKKYREIQSRNNNQISNNLQNINTTDNKVIPIYFSSINNNEKVVPIEFLKIAG